MNQSTILRASYEIIYKNLAALGEETKLFSVCGKGGEVSDNGSKVILGISDICQLSQDKNGEKVEEDEKIFEAPTRVGCALFLTVTAKEYPELLETAGRLIQYFKDNNYISLGEYKWHGEEGGKVFIEPVVCEPEPRAGYGETRLPGVTLKYTMEMGINSEKGISFKRVEKKAIKGGIINNN